MFKTLILPWLLPIFGMFFAAGADALSGGDAGGLPDAGDEAGSDSSTTGGDTTDLDGTGGVDSGTEARQTPQRPQTQEEPEFQEFKGLASARLRGWTKNSPKLAEAFKENPELQQKFEATLRRDAAYRELYPSLAEARALRDRFPGGLADVQTLETDLKEVEQLDKDFYTKDADGKYPGHQTLIDNIFRDDRSAALSLFRTIPKEWARLDPDSWNDFGVGMLASTFNHAGTANYLGDLLDLAKEAQHPGLVKGLGQLLGWVQSYLKGKPEPTEAERKLSQERANFDRDRATRDQEDGQKYDQTFSSTNTKIEQDAIKAHPAVQKLLANKAIPAQKKAAILAEIQRQIRSQLQNSPAFMRKLTAAYNARNLGESSNVVKAAWSQQWLLNRFVRTVLNKETPQLVQANREMVRRRAGTLPPKPANTSERRQNNQPTGPKQIGGRWYRDGGRGPAYTTAEVLAGKHLQQ